MLLVVELTVRRAELATFRAFEHAAAQIMARHGGAIEHAFVVDDGEPFRELHIVRFPDEAAFAAYQQDPALAAHADARARAVIATQVRRASPGPRYGAPLRP